MKTTKKNALQVNETNSIRSNKKDTADLVSYLKELPPHYTSFGSRQGEMRIRVTPELAETLRDLIRSIDFDDQPKFLFDNLVNELIKEFFIRHIESIALVAQQHLMREKKKGDRQLDYLKKLNEV